MKFSFSAAGVLLVASVAWSSISGVVSNRAGSPVAGVQVRQVGTGQIDTTDAFGAWSFESTGVTGRSALRLGWEGDALVVSLAEPGAIRVEALRADGRSRFLLERTASAGTLRLVLPAAAADEQFVRVRTASGERVLPRPFRASSAPRSSAAARSMGIVDTLVLRKQGYKELRHPMSEGQSVFASTLDSAYAPPMVDLRPDTAVAYEVTQIALAWTVTSGLTLKSLALNGLSLEPATGARTSRQPLAVGRNVFRLVAIDAEGSIGSDSVVVERRRSATLLANWAPDSVDQDTLRDQSGNGRDLVRKSSGNWRRAYDSALAAVPPSGKIMYRVKVYLNAYPDSTLFNAASTVVGYYAGPKMMISSKGQLMVAGQRGDSGNYAWYTARTRNRAVLLNRWTTLAVGADQATGEFSAWIDGVPQQLYASRAVSGSRLRVHTAEPFSLGGDAVDNQPFSGRIANVQVHNTYLDSAGPAVRIEPCIENKCESTLVPRAIWRVDSTNQTTLVDKAGNGANLTLVSNGIWKRLMDSSLVALPPSGRILYSAKIRLQSYPADSEYNKSQTIVGFNCGLKMMVTSSGQLVAVAQKGKEGAYTWYGPRTETNSVPLNRWTTLAVGVDQSTAELYAWIDGVAVDLYVPSAVSGSRLRVAPVGQLFMLGADNVDGQKFKGKIGEVKVWSDFVYGPAPATKIDADIVK